MIGSIKEASAITGCLSNVTKMPGRSYGLPASSCITGSKLAAIPNSVCSTCYALKGNYRFSPVKAAQQRRLASITKPEWVEAMAYQIQHQTSPTDPYFRWHDSGDIQSREHLAKICEVARRTPAIKHWLPTREKGIVMSYLSSGGQLPDNLIIRISASLVDQEPAELHDSRVQSSMVSKNTPQTSTGVYNCPASKQGGVCGSCRACWDKSVSVVSYAWH